MKTIRLIAKCILFVLFLISIQCTSISQSDTITMESLLDEMVSVEELALFPQPYYTTHQESSYDRRSISPDQAGWFANNDGFGIIREDTIDGRIEKVMFDEVGAGVITRIWITTIDKRGTWRFYFDGNTEPSWIVDGYDLMKFNIPSLGKGLLQPHTSYEPDGKGGNTLFLPIPYATGCKITFEDAEGVNPTPKYYGINFRKYPEDTRVESFSKEVVERCKDKIAKVDELLLNPKTKSDITLLKEEKRVSPSSSILVDLPNGQNAVYDLIVKVDSSGLNDFGQIMRELILVANFDNKETVWVPLSDYSGGGMGAPYVKSWYLNADGGGKVTSHWLMPYKEKGSLSIINLSQTDVNITMEISTAPLAWNDRSLYFHSSWKQENGIYIHNNPDEAEKCLDWNFTEIEGRGIYKGDILSLFNHAPRWYGEGDEKIWIDNDTFPSHFGTGTEDYYNSSWAPVYPFHTPFGGAPRADLPSSHGYNTFFRTRNLDGIPFNDSFRFDIEMIGWDSGYVDYATTTYWYGDYNAHTVTTSGAEEAKKKLVPTPYNPADYNIENSIEFENARILNKSENLHISTQLMHDFSDGRWSKATQLLGRNGNVGDYIELEFDYPKKGKYDVILYATHAKDFGILSFTLNGKPTNINFDAYGTEVTNSRAIKLGQVDTSKEKIILKVELIGTNKQSQGDRYFFGLDCLQSVSSN